MLYKHQIEAAKFIAERTRSLLADSAGTGKTLSALLAGEIYAKNIFHRDINILIICPASLRFNWKKEINIWCLSGIPCEDKIAIIDGNEKLENKKIIIINPERLHQTKIYNFLRKKTWDFLIVDEAHKFKNPKTRQFIFLFGGVYKRKAITPIKSLFKLFMTATPLNRPIDLWPIVYICAPKTLGKSWLFFVKRYCNGFRGPWGWDVSGNSNLDELHERMKEFTLRRRLEDVLTNLPSLEKNIIILPPIKSVLDKETEFIRAYIEKSYPDRNKEQEEDLYQQKKKFSEDFLSQADNLKPVKKRLILFSKLSEIRRLTGEEKIKDILNYLLSSFIFEKKVVVFAYHKNVIEELYKQLKLNGGAVKLSGNTPAKKREENICAFQTNPEIKWFVGSIGAASEGITLTASHHLVFAEIDWNATTMEQAQKRIHRITQDKKCLVYYLISEESLDVHILKIMLKKLDIIQKVII